MMWTVVCVVVSLMVPVSSEESENEDVVVGIIPSLASIPSGITFSLLESLEKLVKVLLRGGTMLQLQKIVFDLLLGVKTAVNDGVEDLGDTLEEPVEWEL